jgi:iduronate 2-sulfatase
MRWAPLILSTLYIISAYGNKKQFNVLFIISDDLTYTALSCYGNKVCQTPNIDKLAQEGIRFTQAFCQATYCGPSRASFMSGYYPHATGVLGYKNPRPQIGKRATWPQHFRNHGYHAARVSKVYHMGVPGGIEKGEDGADDALSWDEKYNSKGPEWRAPGDGETLQKNPKNKRPVIGGNTFVVVEADGDDLVHADGKTAKKAVLLIKEYENLEKPFWLGVGFVRPHVPFVAPRKYYKPFTPYSNIVLPEKFPDDWNDIPKAGINYCTSENMQMDIRKQKKAVGGYYASVAFLDAQVGKVMDALEKSGKRDKTIVIFTSDHGFHLGEHDFWAKVSLRDESAKVPLIISVPGKKPAVCNSFVELLDLYPTLSNICGLPKQGRLQGKDISKMLDEPKHQIREEAFSVAPMRTGFLLRSKQWAFIQYGENLPHKLNGGFEHGRNGIELFEMGQDPHQFSNLADTLKYQPVVESFRKKLKNKLIAIRKNDLIN